MPTTSSAFPPEYFDKADPSDDALFYEQPRMVVHIDDAAIAALAALYNDLLPAGGTILDLMSSWRSHFPEQKQFARVIGQGMNSAEMAANPRLDEHFVHNLNADPIVPFPDATFDAVTCAVSVQYLQSPVEVFAELFRVLKPGGVCIISFSNRCFPTKAIAAWQHSGDLDHITLVNSYFQISGQWEDPHVRMKPPVAGEDPLFMLWAHKPLE